MAFSAAAAALSGGEGKSYSNQQLVVTGKPRQIGICQRSLTRRCRLGRATELVFITAMGAMITIGGQATAQSITYNDGETRTATLDTTGDIDLTVNAGEATQSGVISGSGNLDKQGTGTLTLSEANTYTGTTTIDAGTLRITNVDALGANAGGTIVADGATLELGEGDFFFGFMEPITLHGAGVADGGALRSVGVEPIVISGAITLGSAARITSDNLSYMTVNGHINGTNQNLTFDGGGDINVQGVIATGSGTLTKEGTGNLYLFGNNSFTGNVFVNAGSLEVVSGAAIDDSALVQVASGATFVVRTAETIGNLSGAGSVFLRANLTLGDASDRSFSGEISGVRNLNKQGAGTLTLTGFNTYSGATTISNGTLQVGNGGTTGTLGTGDVVNNATLRFDRSDDVTVSNVISGTGNLVKQGAGRLTLSGTNTYSGTTTINEGTLRIGDSSGLGSTAGGTIVADGATLELLSVVNLNEAITLNGDGVAGGGALRSIGGSTSTISGAITLGSAARITSTGLIRFNAGSSISGPNQNLTFDGGGAIDMFGTIATGSGSLTKEGTGTLRLYGNNTFTGDVFVNAGTLQARSGAAIGDAALVQVASGADFSVSEAETIGNLSGAGFVSLSAELTLGDANDRSFSGVIREFGGARNLIKQGAGTLTLSGANTYTGTTTINGGTLQIGAGGTTGSLGTGGVVNNATLRFDRSDDVTVSNVISGTGNLFKQGTGILTLSGENTYSGTTAIDAGTLRVTHADALGTNAGGTVVADGATLELSGGITTSEPIMLNGAGVAGGGALRSAGGVNRVTGAITLGSAARITATSNLGITGTSTISGTNQNLTLDGGGIINVNGVIATGSGTLTKEGTGTAILYANNTFTGDVFVNAGRLELWYGAGAAIDDGALVQVASGATLAVFEAETIGNLLGAGAVVMGADMTLGDASDRSFSGVISSSGGLIKQGTGTLTLSGANTYTGTTTVSGGRLLVNGSLASAATTVQNGGTLAGAGTLGAVIVNSGGTLAAGNSIGTLNTGNITFDTGAVLQVEVDPADAARADLINATGNVTINGGTVRHIGENATYDPSRTWRIVTASGNLTGTFTGVTSDFDFLDPTLIYGTNSVDLRLVRNDVSFDSVARTGNQKATANGIETISGSTVFNTLAGLSGATATAALDAFSGEGLVAMDAGLLTAGSGLAAFGAAQLGASGGGAGDLATRGTLWNEGSRFWASLYGASHQSGGGDFKKSTWQDNGLAVGYTWDSDTAWQFAGMVAAGTANSSTPDLATTGEVANHSLGLFAARDLDGLHWTFGLVSTKGDIDSQRRVTAGGLAQTLTARYDNSLQTAFAKVSRDLTAGDWTWSPFAQMTAQHLSQGAFTETGGDAAITRTASTDTSLRAKIGASSARDLTLGTLPATWSAHLAVSKELEGSGTTAQHAIAGSTPFSITSTSTSADTQFDLGMGFDLQLAAQTNLTLSAQTSHSGGVSQTTAGLQLGIRF
ncbi:MAG: autotransporter-associated beta strand repeat-containing protein [Loktanella sp.]|nr:autotransporter-associated beta strand repeat-containing protein [Loktanella sp.]